ncbi:hypothetical protein WR25_04079 [Diploscapter pachys]|uniref:EGF-like domain-containing protein n=1 Tax=Diploscapter pachys TaxID=2018661 RepID=A0A2A2J658_9BILA|nr:hypothetical protein WR25_04079 [Diploscapter pachys]
MPSFWYLTCLLIALTTVAQARIQFLDKTECEDLDFCNDRGLCWNDYPKKREAHCLCINPYEGDKCEKVRPDHDRAMVKSAPKSIRAHRILKAIKDRQTHTVRQGRQRATMDE